MIQIGALRSRLEKQPTDPAMAGRKPRYLWDRTPGHGSARGPAQQIEERRKSDLFG
jgi:hypothetical protein